MNRGNNGEGGEEEEAPPCYDDAVSQQYVDLERGGGSGTANSGTALSTYRHVDLDPSDTDGDVDGGRPRGSVTPSAAVGRSPERDRERELHQIRRADGQPTMVRYGPMVEYVGGVSGWPTASTPKSQVARFTMLGGYFAPMKLVPEFQPKLAGVPLEVNATLHHVDQVLSASSAGHIFMLVLHIFVALFTFPFGLIMFIGYYFTYTFYINAALRRVTAYLLTENTTPTYKDAHLYWAVVDNFIELRTTSTGPDDGFYVLAPGRPCCCCWGCCRC